MARARSSAPGRPSGSRSTVTREGPEHFMQEALAEGLRGLGRTHPNPAVGAVIVRDGRIVGRGHHRRAGLPHAEVEAIRAAGPLARGADLYVTLEPCNHVGRTGPCTLAVIEAGLTRVFVGSLDANPHVEGRGLQRLREAGLAVHTGVLVEPCDALIRGFMKHVTTGRPFVVLKAAITLDGKIATSTGDSRWVSGPESRRLVHGWRDELDAVLVGAGTVIADDPLLTTRLDAPAVQGREPRTPVRIVLDGRLRAPPSSKIFDIAPGPVLVATTVESGPAVEALRARGVEILTIPGEAARLSPGALLAALGRRGLTSLLVEGGADVHRGFLEAGLADELRLFIAPRIVGGDGLSWVGPLGVREMSASLAFEAVRHERAGEDLLVVARPKRD